MFHKDQQIGVYTLVKRIGRGGFGEVWLAERRGRFATTQVAVKLPIEDQLDPAAIEQEAKLWVKASGHPNVLPLIEANDYDGQIVIVSEYAPDGSLQELLKNGGPLPVEDALNLAIGILNGLEFLHSQGIIHRDLKPANILLQGRTPRLADFGISRAMSQTSATENIAGTPQYMAPEALDGKRNVKTDIWSVGVVLYQMLSGSLPFPQNTFGELCNAVFNREPQPLPASISSQLQIVVGKALSKDVAGRYQTAREMREDLNVCLWSLKHPHRPPVDPEPVEEDETETVVRPAPVVVPEIKRKTNWLYFVVPGFLIAVVIGVGAILFVASRFQGPDYLALGKACTARKDYECAIENYSKAIKAGSKNAEAYVGRAWAYLDKSKYEDAILDCDKALELNADNAEAYAARGWARAYQEDFKSALADCDKAIELQSDLAEAYACRGASQVRQDNYARGFKDCDKAIKLKPDFAPSYNCRGLANYGQNNLKDALKDFDKALQLKPDYARAYNNRGITRSSQKQDDAALEDFSQAIKLEPNLDAAYRNRADIYFQKKKFELALNDCHKAVSLKPSANAYRCRGRAYFFLNNFTQAINDFDTWISLSPSVEAYLYRADSHSNLGAYEDAIEDYTEAIKLKPSAPAYFSRGTAHYNQKEYDEAIEDYNRAIQLDPNHANAYNYRGNAYYNKGDYLKAISDYRRALAIDPNINFARENLDKALSLID
ncbi:MAG TPA: tetratricopeptide repeat protein [Pyrinomonadaceae bacterium]|nr:tetratricopeptide repeat protein [Pyrinomonadaceae bacterium]